MLYRRGGEIVYDWRNIYRLRQAFLNFEMIVAD